jgi:uncharacterized protein (TIGR00730 family)
MKKFNSICVYGASSKAISEDFKACAYNIGKEIAIRGYTLVFGGGAEGVMGESARGAYENGGKILGIAPTFFDVDGILFENCTEFIYPETMRIRKQLLEDKSDAFIVAPGGIGTLDEFFEILTLKQLSRHNKPIVLFNQNGFYDNLVELLEHLADNKFMTHATIDLCFITDDIYEAFKYIEEYDDENMPITHFKYVNNQLKKK